MDLKRFTGVLAGTAVAGSGALVFGLATAAPAAADDCVYKVRTQQSSLNVRSGPSSSSAVIDSLGHHDYTVGGCGTHGTGVNAGKWRNVQGTTHGRNGFAHGDFLTKLGKVTVEP
ncbi:hypothetical protein GCM10010466_28580 [Planomonospora alba]|uniref:SH3 domain-containing protein n=1 Tax=Planomonospora alba TaxID=161354 RepID=A0ABP6N5M1_9ACTN